MNIEESRHNETSESVYYLDFNCLSVSYNNKYTSIRRLKKNKFSQEKFYMKYYNVYKVPEKIHKDEDIKSYKDLVIDIDAHRQN